MVGVEGSWAFVGARAREGSIWEGRWFDGYCDLLLLLGLLHLGCEIGYKTSTMLVTWLHCQTHLIESDIVL